MGMRRDSGPERVDASVGWLDPLKAVSLERDELGAA